MTAKEISIIVIALILVAVAIIAIIIICSHVYSAFRKKVKVYSTRYQNLQELNKKYEFFSFKSNTVSYNLPCNSKYSFDHVNLLKVFMTYIEKHLESYEKLIYRIDENRKKYKQYCSDYNTLKSTVTKEDSKKFGVPLKTFVNIENKLVNKEKLHPQLSFTTIISATYTSPKGRNYYHKHDDYGFDQTVKCYERVKELIEEKKTHKYQVQVERAKMSNSLRYDVLKRDGFRCQICGATAQEGAKLHVDHIVPVSKGGKTELSNLRTLCDRCNMGKSNKIE